MNNISIIIPIYNEFGSIDSLYNEISNTLKNVETYEIIFVDDSSTDKSNELLRKYFNNKLIKAVFHYKNLGQSQALLSGIKIANHDTIVTLDGDGQNVPKDIPKLLKIYFSSKEIFLVSGIRQRRNDSTYKIISSKIANKIRSIILRDNCSDTGCGLKVFSKRIFLKFPFFNGIHRFLPALFNGYGYKTIFTHVSHRPRLKGVSKYGTFDRLFKGIVDIIRVMIIINIRRKEK
tara:strand:- start:570 stop:1268 length:699 start_codon:yes stop_codon:yes gene_type:complete